MSDLKDQLNEKIATKVFRSYTITSPRNELNLKPPKNFIINYIQKGYSVSKYGLTLMTQVIQFNSI